jgi:hypothetical protein
MSATGSVNLIVCFSSATRSLRNIAENLQQLQFFYRWSLSQVIGQQPMTKDKRQTAIYQDDLETPGISPRSARLRKQSRQSPNLRR